MVQHVLLLASHAARAGARGDRRALSAGRAWWCAALLAVLAPLAGAESAPLTVLTWNVENYVAEDRLVDGVYRPDYPKPERAKQALRAVLRAVRPDVVALQEMGPEPYLVELQRDLAAEGLELPHRAIVNGPDAVRHVAVLSRVPLARAAAHGAVATRFAGPENTVRRGVLEVAVAVDGVEVTLFVFHLKSRHTEDPRDPQAAAQRAAEAEAVRDLVLRGQPEPAGAAFLLLGDANDAPGSRPLRALQRRGETAIATLLPATDGRGDVWTYFHRREATYARIDYVLASAAAVPLVVGGCGQIVDSADVRAASDHRPLVVRLARPATSTEKAGPGGPASGKSEGAAALSAP